MKNENQAKLPVIKISSIIVRGANRINTGEFGEVKMLKMGSGNRTMISGGKFLNAVKSNFESQIDDLWINRGYKKLILDKLLKYINQEYPKKSEEQIVAKINIIYNEINFLKFEVERITSKELKNIDDIINLEGPLIISDEQLRYIARQSFLGNDSELKSNIQSVMESVLTPTELVFGQMYFRNKNAILDGHIYTGIEFTTHDSALDRDYFRCIDILKESTGSVMIGSVTFGSGIYFRESAIDPQCIYETFPKDVSTEILDILIKSIIYSNPIGGRSRYLSNNLPDNILVEILEYGVNPLQNAFQYSVFPKSTGGYLENSIRRMIDYCEYIESQYKTNYMYKGVLGKEISSICANKNYNREKNITTMIDNINMVINKYWLI